MSQTTTKVFLKLPLWARLLNLSLLLLTVSILVHSLILLLRAGQESVGLVAAGIGLAGAVLPLFGFFWKDAQGLLSGLPGVERLKPWGIVLLLQCMVALAILFGTPAFLGIAAEDLINQALVATDENNARAALNNAQMLGADVSASLETQLVINLDTPITAANDEQSLRIARLYADFASEQMRQDRAGEIEARVYSLVGPQTYAETQRLMQVLAQIDPVRAGNIAREFYDLAIAEFAAQPPETALALAHLNAIFAVNGPINIGISDEEISYAYFLRGQALESSDPASAFNSYRQAISVYADNLEAYYSLASGLLVQVEPDPEATADLTAEDITILDEVVRVADTGRIRIDSRFCRGSQDLTHPETFRYSWFCFLLLTTDGGARVLRGGGEDNISTITSVLQPAINLAEANNHFGESHFTAEAYYWLAHATEPNPFTNAGRELYCSIILEVDRSKPRHVSWLAYANERLGGQLCIPG